MSARDELLGTLSNTICNASNYPDKAVPHLLGGDMSKVIDKTADAILAAGYRKPRIITTAEELDALAEGVVLLDKYGAANQLALERITEGPADRFWDTTGHDRNSSVALPATVLYEP